MFKYFYKKSRENCERYCTQKHRDSSIIISMKSSFDKERPRLYISEKNKIEAILFLSVDDTEDVRYGMSCETAEEIVDFVNEYKDKVDQLIVHCDAGISRSAGVLYAIKEELTGEIVNPKRVRNMLCYNRVKEAFKERKE